MLDMRRREEAEGERRMIGSTRLEAPTALAPGLPLLEMVGLVPGRVGMEEEAAAAERGSRDLSFLGRKTSRCLRTWEKSWKEG
jgi:hypothetical protein